MLTLSRLSRIGLSAAGLALAVGSLALAGGISVESMFADDEDAGLPEGVVAFVDVSVVPMDRDRTIGGRTVLVEGQRIARIGLADSVEVPDEATVVRGGWLMPGLGEMHAHVPPEGGRAWMEDVLFLYLANGITTVRGMLGQPEHLELRDAVAAGEVAGPRIYTSGPSLNGTSIPSPDSARRAVRHQVVAGYDFLKIHPGLTREEYDAMVEEATEAGIRWAGHVPAAVGLERALEAGQASVDHLDRYVEALVPEGADASGGGLFGYGIFERADPERIPEVARATVEAGVWNVPTQSLIERLLAEESADELAAMPEVRYVPEETVDDWRRRKRSLDEEPRNTPERARAFIELRREIIRALHEAGAGLLLGSDAPQVFQVPGFSVHDELRILVESGLTPYEALVTGTRNVAAFFGAQDEYGTVEEGKVADLVLLGSDPLADVGNASDILGVMARGRWLPAASIRERLETIATARSGD